MLVFTVQLCVMALFAGLTRCWPTVLEASISDRLFIPFQSSSLSDTSNETLVIAFWIKSLTLQGEGYMVHPTTPRINFGALKLEQSSVDPSIFNSTATAQYVTYRGYFWVAFVFRRVPPYQVNSNLILDKVIYDRLPASLSPEVTDNIPLSNMFGIFTHSNQYINNPNDVQIMPNSGMISLYGYTSYSTSIGTRTVFELPPTDLDWSDPKFVRALRYGLTQSVLSSFNLDAPEDYFRFMINGSFITREQVAYARRDGYNKIGLPMYIGSTFSIENQLELKPGFMSVIHIYGAAGLLQTTDAKVTFTQRATIRTIAGTLVQAVADVVLSNNGLGGLVIQLQNVAWRFYMTNGTNPYIATNQASAQIGTLTAAMIKRYMKVVIMTSLQYSGNGGSEPNTFSGLGWMWATVMADVAETQPQNVVQRSEAWVKSIFDIESENYFHTFFEIDTMLSECNYKSANPTGEDYNITFFSQDLISGFPDWEALIPGYTYDKSYAGNCYRQMPPAYMDANNSCPLFRHTFANLSWGGSCRFKWAPYDSFPCVHCNTGYYPDVTRYRVAQPYDTCKSKSECIALSNSGFVYINKYEGTAYDNRGMCLSCPPNCKSCDANLNCVECLSPMMNTTSQHCDCPVSGCLTCLTTTCDLCPYSSYLHYDSRTQIRTCEWGSCLPTFGRNKSYVYGTASGFSSLMCVRCYHQNCAGCADDYTVCNKYCAVGESLVDYNFALAPDTSRITYCTDKAAQVAGYVYDPAIGYFTLCAPNCTRCLATNTSQCLSCATGNVYLVDQMACTALSACPNGTYIEPGKPSNCKDCMPNCTFCLNGSLSCQQCTAGMIFHADQKKCVPLIDCTNGSGSFVSSGVCQNCLTGCATCTDLSSCDECLAAKFLAANKSICMDSCPVGENPVPSSHSCSLCLGQCATCTTNTSYCLTCKPGFYLNEDHACVDCLQQGYGLAGSVCKACSVKDCMSCTYNPDECTECKPHYVWKEGSCEPCTALMYQDANSKCQECNVEYCSRCVNGSATCEACVLGYALGDGKCNEANSYDGTPRNSTTGSIILYSTFAGKPLMFLLAIAMLLIAQSYAISLIKIYQMMKFMQLFSMSYPDNFQGFITIFQATNPIDFSLQKLFNPPSRASCPDMDVRLLERDFDCQFVANASQSLNVVTCWIASMLILKIASKYFKSIEGKDQIGLTANGIAYIQTSVQEESTKPKDSLPNQVPFKDRILQWAKETSTTICSMRAVHFLAQTLDIDVMLAIVLNARYYSNADGADVLSAINKFIPGMVLLTHSTLIMIVFFRTKSARQDPEGPNSYLLKGRHLRYRYQTYREVLWMLRNYAASLLIVLLYSTPFVQLGIITAILLVFACADIYYQPFVASVDNVVAGVSNFCYALSSCVLLLAKIFESRATSVARNNFFGYPLIVLFSGAIVASILPAAYALYQWSKKTLQINRVQASPRSPTIPLFSTITQSTPAQSGEIKAKLKRRDNIKIYSTALESANIHDDELNLPGSVPEKLIGGVEGLELKMPKTLFYKVETRLHGNEITPLTLSKNVRKVSPAKCSPKRLKLKKKPLSSNHQNAGPESERGPIMVDSSRIKKA